jgi:uncharacterized membrane protein
MTTAPEVPPVVPPAKEDTTIAMLAYLTPLLFGVGIVIAIVMHGNNKTKLGAYHLRQSLGLLLTGLALWIPSMIASFVLAFIPFLGLLLAPLWFLVGIAFLVIWVMALIAAINGQYKPVPVLGAHYEKWFANAFT